MIAMLLVYEVLYSWGGSSFMLPATLDPIPELFPTTPPEFKKPNRPQPDRQNDSKLGFHYIFSVSDSKGLLSNI